MTESETEKVRRPRRTDPRIQARRVSVARQRGRRRRRRILGGFLAVGVLAGGFELVHSPVFGARHVDVVGAPNIPRSTFIAVAGLRRDPPLIDLDASVIAARVERLAWVASAHVAIAWPSTVSIHVIERVPVAAVALAGSTAIAICDVTGRVLEIVASRPASLPLLVLPASATSYVPGAYLSPAGRVLAQIAAAMPESMVSEISEVTANSLGAILDIPGKPTAILGGPSSLGQKFVSLATVLAHGDLSDIAAIDLRVPTAPVLLPKGSSRIPPRKVGG